MTSCTATSTTRTTTTSTTTTPTMTKRKKWATEREIGRVWWVKNSTQCTMTANLWATINTAMATTTTARKSPRRRLAMGDCRRRDVATANQANATSILIVEKVSMETRKSAPNNVAPTAIEIISEGDCIIVYHRTINIFKRNKLREFFWQIFFICNYNRHRPECVNGCFYRSFFFIHVLWLLLNLDFTAASRDLSDYVITERWRDVEQPLNASTKILSIWQAWGSARNEVIYTTTFAFWCIIALLDGPYKNRSAYTVQYLFGFVRVYVCLSLMYLL